MKKECFIGIVLGLVFILAVCILLNYRLFSRSGQNNEQGSQLLKVGDLDKPGLEDLRYVELQISAVTVDMQRCLGWFPEEKGMMKEAAVKAVDELKGIRDYLVQLELTGNLVKLREIGLAVINKLTNIYNGIESKKTEDISEEFVAFNNLYRQYSEALEKTFNWHEPDKKLPDDYNSIEEETKLIQDEQDRKKYLEAVRLIENGKFGHACKSLESLKGKYKDTNFEDCIRLRISDCLVTPTDEDGDEATPGQKRGIELLANIIGKEQYSPVLYQAFYKWRTQTQACKYGMSNMSVIPNGNYNRKRWKAIQTIKQYIRVEPDDKWAIAQLNMLLVLPNINRGGPFGNDNIVHYHKLYPR